MILAPADLTLAKIGGMAENGVTVTFINTIYTLILNINCDETARGEVTLPIRPETGLSSVTMEWNSFITCPGGQSGSSSWGTPLLIAACVAGVVYAGGGYYYNSRQKGLNGKEALPHVDFWTQELPLAVRDGLHFTKAEFSARFLGGSRGAGPSGSEMKKSNARSDDPASETDSNDDDSDDSNDSGSSDEEAPVQKKPVRSDLHIGTPGPPVPLPNRVLALNVDVFLWVMQLVKKQPAPKKKPVKKKKPSPLSAPLE